MPLVSSPDRSDAGDRRPRRWQRPPRAGQSRARRRASRLPSDL